MQSKIEIIPESAVQSEIDAIYEQIEQLFIDTYQQLGDELPVGASVEVPLNAVEYFRLLVELEILQNKGCYITPTESPKGGIGYMQIQEEGVTARRFQIRSIEEEYTNINDKQSFEKNTSCSDFNFNLLLNGEIEFSLSSTSPF